MSSAIITTVKTLRERFASKYIVRESGCWEWQSTKTKAGYGTISRGRACDGHALAHRISHELFKGPIPEGLEIDHLCRNVSCVNPDHIEAVTHAENMARTERAQQTHCKYGHEFTPENTIRIQQWKGQSGQRRCKQCNRDRMNRRYAEGKVRNDEETRARKRASARRRYEERHEHVLQLARESKARCRARQKEAADGHSV